MSPFVKQLIMLALALVLLFNKPQSYIETILVLIAGIVLLIMSVGMIKEHRKKIKEEADDNSEVL